MDQDTSFTPTVKETILIQLNPLTDKDILDKLHTSFTENAPTKFYHNNVIEVENHYTQRRYSVRGEEVLDVVQQKQLQYTIEDGSTITILYQEQQATMSIVMDVCGESFPNVLEKSGIIRDTLSRFIDERISLQ